MTPDYEEGTCSREAGISFGCRANYRGVCRIRKWHPGASEESFYAYTRVGTTEALVVASGHPRPGGFEC